MLGLQNNFRHSVFLGSYSILSTLDWGFHILYSHCVKWRKGDIRVLVVLAPQDAVVQSWLVIPRLSLWRLPWLLFLVLAVLEAKCFEGKVGFETMDLLRLEWFPVPIKNRICHTRWERILLLRVLPGKRTWRYMGFPHPQCPPRKWVIPRKLQCL